MDLSLIIFSVIVILFAISGYRSGFLIVLSRLISLPAAYLVAIFYTKPFGQWLQSVSSLEGLMSYVVGGTLLFIATATLVSLLFSTVRRFLVQPNATATQVSAIGGGILGAVIGVVIGLMAVWFSSTMQALWQTKQGNAPNPASAFEKKVKELTGNAVGGITSVVSDQDDFSEATAVLIANPAENIERIQRLTHSGLLSEVLNSNAARSALDQRDPGALYNTPAFQELVNNPDLIELAQAMKFSDNPDSLKKDMAVKLTQVWAQIDQVKTNPRFVELTQDSEVSQMIKSGNIYRMINSAKIEELLNVIGSVEVPEIEFREMQPVEEKKVEIHRWVDEKGRVHYSDKKKEN